MIYRSATVHPNVTTKTTSLQSTATPQNADPYAGWKSYTLRYEKISFKYPSNWILTDTSGTTSAAITPGEDLVKIKSSDPLEIFIHTGIVNPDYGCPSNKVLSSTTLKLLNATYYLNFLGGCDEGGVANNDVSGGSIYTTAASLYPYPSSKNITISKSAVAGLQGPVNLITIMYTTGTGYPVSYFKQDINYEAAVKILESMAY